MTRLVCAFVIAVLLCCTSVRADDDPQVLTTVYGRKLTGAVSFEQDLFRVTGSETAWAVKAKAVQDVRFSQLRKMPDSKMQAIVSTRYGSIFACSLLAKREPEHLTCSTAEFGTVSLGFQHLRAIRFHGEDVWISPGSFASELEQLPAQRLDLLKLSNGDTYKCIVLSLSNDGVTVETGGRELKFARSALDTIVFAESDRRNSSMYALVNSVYANSYALMLRSLDGKSLVGELVSGPFVKFEPKDITRMSIVNGAVLDLTTRKPSEVSYRPFFKQTWEYRLNRSLSGGPLKVNGVAYEKGIATHSFTSLTFELGGKYSRFSAICGVDDSAADEGSVDFRVLLDGRVVYESGVLKKGEQSRVDLKLGDAKELVLETGFGGDDDIGDHGDWCVPRLIEDIAQAVRKLPVQSPNGG